MNGRKDDCIEDRPPANYGCHGAAGIYIAERCSPEPRALSPPPEADRSVGGRTGSRCRGLTRLRPRPPWASTIALTRLRPEAEPSFGPALVAAVEALPDARQLVGGNADAGVADAQDRVRPVAARLDLDAPAGGRVLDGVVEQVGDHLPHAVAVDVDHDVVADGSIVERDAAVLGDVLVELDGLRDQLGQVRRARGAARIVPVSASEMSISVLSIATHAVGLLEAVGERFAQRRRVVADCSAVLGDAAQPGHRRPQIVRDVVERAAHAGDRPTRCDRASR